MVILSPRGQSLALFFQSSLEYRSNCLPRVLPHVSFSIDFKEALLASIVEIVEIAKCFVQDTFGQVTKNLTNMANMMYIIILMISITNFKDFLIKYKKNYEI